MRHAKPLLMLRLNGEISTVYEIGENSMCTPTIFGRTSPHGPLMSFCEEKANNENKGLTDTLVVNKRRK